MGRGVNTSDAHFRNENCLHFTKKKIVGQQKYVTDDLADHERNKMRETDFPEWLKATATHLKMAFKRAPDDCRVFDVFNTHSHNGLTAPRAQSQLCGIVWLSIYF